MKKFSIVFISICVTFFATLLCACTFKDPKAQFSKDEHIVEIGELTDLDTYLELTGVEKHEITYRFSDSSLFDVDGHKITAKASGKSKVYAFYEESNLASMQIVVRKQFDAPTASSIRLEGGNLIWNAVTGWYEGEKEHTVASSYTVEWTYTSADQQTEDANQNGSKVVETNSLNMDGFKSGIYTFKIKANTYGYFDESKFAISSPIYYGYMNQIKLADFEWNSDTGVLSWNWESADDAKYEVRVNNVLLTDLSGADTDGLISTNSVDLSSCLAEADGGEDYEVTIVAHDANDVKYEMASETFVITKLATPDVSSEFSATNGGQILIKTNSSVEKYKIVVENTVVGKLEFSLANEGQDILTTLDFLTKSGVYDISVIAENHDEGKHYFRSDANEFGKIYKLPSVTLSGKVTEGKSPNLENSSIFRLDVEGSALVAASLKVSSKTKSQIYATFEDGIEWIENTSGEYVLSAVLQSKNAMASVEGGMAYIINSNASEEITLTKVGEVGTVMHQYDENRNNYSVLTFDEVAFADKNSYQLLYFDGEGFNLVEEDKILSITVVDKVVTIVLNGRVENLFEAVGSQFKFKVLAKTLDDFTAINSLMKEPKTLTLLGQPSAPEQNNPQNGVFTWNAVANADKYNVEIYYTDNKAIAEYKDLSLFEKTTTTVTATQYAFTKVGYYVVRVYAVADKASENSYISSAVALEREFNISKQVEIGEVQLRNNGSSIFLRIFNVDSNVKTYTISVTGQKDETLVASGESYDDHALNKNFFTTDTEITIAIFANSSDAVLRPSDSYVLTVEKLRNVTPGDIQVDDDYGNLISLIPYKAGITSKITYSTSKKTSSSVGRATLNVSDLTANNFALTFEFVGSDLISGIYDIKDDKVYLTCDEGSNTIEFSRIAQPEQLVYENGKFTYAVTGVPSNGYNYIFEIAYTNNKSNFLISVKFDGVVTATATGSSAPIYLGVVQDFLNEGTNTIDFAAVEEAIYQEQLLEACYRQMAKPRFSLLVKYGQYDSLSNKYLLSSRNSVATEIERLPEVKIALEYIEADNNYKISWDVLKASSAEISNVTYKLYVNAGGVDFTEVVGFSVNYEDSDDTKVAYLTLNADNYQAGVFYNFYLVVSHPHYLGQSLSNNIIVYRLNSIDSLTLDENKLKATVADVGYAQKVVVSANGTAKDYDKIANNGNVEIAIEGEGEYTVKVVAKDSTFNDVTGVTTYYIGSVVTKWTLSLLQTLVGDNLPQLTFASEVVTWDKFVGNFGENLNYVLLFKDKNGKTAQTSAYKTSGASVYVELENTSQIYRDLATLAAGKIEIQVSAHISSYSTNKNGVIYYANAQTLLSGKQEYNHYLYEKIERNKLATPNISNITFDSGESNSKIESPDVVVEFKGDYDFQSGAGKDKFKVYLSSTSTAERSQANVAIRETESGVFKFTLTAADYAFIQPNDTLIIEILATSDQNMPSTVGSEEVYMAKEVRSVEFENVLENGKVFATQKVVVTFMDNAPDYTLGKVVLKVTDKDTNRVYYLDYEATINSGTLSCDLSNFIETNFKSGANINVEAFINSYSADGKYILTCKNAVGIDIIKNIIVLGGVATTDDYSESKTYNDIHYRADAGGFQILAPTDKELPEDIVFVVSYQVGDYAFETKEVTADDEFYFEFPSAWSDEGQYSLKIYAKQRQTTDEGVTNVYVNSWINTLTFAINRVTKISQVVFARDELDPSEINITWNSVANVSEYIFRVFNNTNGKLIFTTTTPTTTNTLSELFWANYADFQNVNLTVGTADIEAKFEIISVGKDGKSNSEAYTFVAYLRPNGLSYQSVKVDPDYGTVTLTTMPDYTYLYRFVAGSAVVQDWKTIKASSAVTTLDTSDLDIDVSVAFNLEVIILGNADTTGTTIASEGVTNFVLDSYYWSSALSTTRFGKSNKILDVRYDESDPSSIIIEMGQGVRANLSKILVGLDKNDIFNHNVISLDLDKLKAFGGADGDAGTSTDTTRSGYAYPLADMLAVIKELGVDYSGGNVALYLWLLENEAGGLSYIISEPFVYEITLSDDVGFVKVEKPGSKSDPEDNASTFVLFTQDDLFSFSLTIGINVKIDYVNTTYIYDESGTIIDVKYQEVSVYRFVNTTELRASNYEYYKGQSYYVIDLTSIFEEDAFKDITGNISLEFLRVRVDLNFKFIVTDWLSGFDFVRLAPVTYATLNSGNIEWAEGDAVNTEKYYIYFYGVNEDNTKSDLVKKFAISKQTVFDASKFVGADCFIEVQGVSTDPFVLASLRYLVSEEPVVKNQLSGKLNLTGGSFTIDYDNVNGDETNNIYKFITANRTSDLSYEERAKVLIDTTWKYPFTFKLSSLLNGQVTVRMTFVSITTNRTQSIDVDAKDLLTNLAEFADNNDSYDIIQILGEWADGATTESYKTTISAFADYIQNGSHGVANDKILFDTYFEKIQSGEYSIVYCLLGGASSLNSTWMTFENPSVNNENSLYVNGQTEVRAKREAIDSVTNSYKVIIKKDQIYNYQDGRYTLVDANKYVLQIATKVDGGNSKVYAFSIENSTGAWKLSYLSSNIDTAEFDISKSISVYNADASGNRFEAGGYLMFYINQNNGDSLLGVFGDMVQRTIYGMQIYAVGNNCSLSGKSEYFRLTLLSFGDDFSITDGVLSWTTQLNRKITVMYRTSRGYEFEDSIVTENTYATYSLDGQGAGTYEWLKFVVSGGDVEDNNIIVDSDVYQIDNVYKLSSPTLTNYLGYLSIDETSNGNRARYNASYSDGSFYQYLIYNNNNDSVYIKRIDTTQGKSNSPYLYTPGRDGDEDYRYKSTEVNAESFQVISVGSTVEDVKFTTDLSAADENGYNKNYYLHKLDSSAWTDSVGAPISAIALQSSASSLPAKMLDSVSNLYVTNGKVVWTGVSGRTEDELLEVESGAEIVYRVQIEQYSISKADDYLNENYVEQTVEAVYTKAAELDFTDIEDKLEILDGDKQIYIKISVQALALRCQVNRPNANYVQLVTGEYAYGEIAYASAEEKIYVLGSEINENSSLAELQRLAPVTSLRAVDGQLQWTYSANNLPNGASLTADSFELFYKFIVEDENGKEISGTFEKPIEQSNGSFLIKFTEDKGQMSVGVQKLRVYATTGVNLDSTMLKSRGEEISINKLATISNADFSIEYVGSGVDILDLSSYFATNKNHEVVVTFYNMYGNLVSTTGNPFTLTSSRTKIYLISDASQAYDDEYNVIIDSISGGCNITFKVKYNANNVLYSDVSDFIPLQRVEWQSSDEIVWNAQTGEFTWTYSGYLSLNTGVDAEILGYAVSRDTTLYDDADLRTPSNLENNTIARGTTLDILERGEGYIKIAYLGGQYYISDMFVDRVAVDTYALSANTLLKVVETEGNYSIIKVKDTESDRDLDGLYRVLTTSIAQPEYIIEADYRASGKKYYTTKGTSFKPTVIGSVGITVRVKLGPANIQSETLQYNNGNWANFNLFTDGDGTSTSPYIIATNDDFRNIQYRMKMEDYLKSGEDDNNVFYFNVEVDVNLTDMPFAGVLFKGTFEGIINGKGHKISYRATKTDKLSEGIYVDVGIIKNSVSGVNSTTFERGASLFEKIATNSSISNLLIDANFSDTTTSYTSAHSLIAGLAISNYGMISNIELVGFNSNFSGYTSSSRSMMVYSGIVSQNLGGEATISNCFVSTDMIIEDCGNSQVIFVGGIAFLNQTNAKIINCMTGYSAYTVDFDVARAIPTTNKIQVLATVGQDIIQIAGICITNYNATITDCQNNLEIDVEGTESAMNCTVYIAGLVDYQGGTMDRNKNTGTLNIPHGFGSCSYALTDDDFGTSVPQLIVTSSN